MEKNKHFFNLIILIAVIMVAFSVAYYFLYSLPNYNKEKLKLDQQKQASDIKMAADKAEADQKKQEAEDDTKMSELAKEIQDDCIKNVQSSVVSYFDKSNTTFSPLFYPYENEASFNKNERLLTALDAYQSCIMNDPRYKLDNIAIKSILNDAGIAEVDINNYMVTYRDKTPGLCESFLLSESAVGECNNLKEKKYSF